MRSNSFNFLRFIAAVMVIFSHSFVLSGKSPDPLSVVFLNITTHAVAIFFIISGYLITKSWFNSSSIKEFVKKRFLRIYPAFVIAIIFSIIIGYFGKTKNLSITQFFFANETKQFFLNNLTVFKINYYLPSSFANNPYPGAVNGSLWTIPLEVLMYIMLIILGKIKFLKYPLIILLSSFSVFILNLLLLKNTSLLPKVILLYFPTAELVYFSFYFLMGSFFAIIKKANFLNWNTSIFSILLFCGLSIILPVNYCVIGLLPLLIIWLGENTWLAKYLTNWLNGNDISYGLYLYAFPIQQLIVFLSNGTIKPLPLFLSSFAITSIFAYLSWCFIEKPCLSLKKPK